MTTLPDKELFRVDEVAEYFGVTQSTIRRWIQHGHLPAEKYSRVIRISRETLLAFRKKSKLLPDQ
jgi:excisionase family DNA binding protein